MLSNPDTKLKYPCNLGLTHLLSSVNSYGSDQGRSNDHKMHQHL